MPQFEQVQRGDAAISHSNCLLWSTFLAFFQRENLKVELTLST